MKISKYFTYREALYLPKWDRTATKADGLTLEHLNNLKSLFKRLDAIREHFGHPIVVHVAYRPPAYNALIGGAKGSSHMEGMACDFHIFNMNCDDVRKHILADKLLESLDLRMEDLPNSTWVHVDIRKPGPGGRFFKP